MAVAPDSYIDTTGAAFTLPLAKLLMGCTTGCYVHYPTISTDMLQMVYERRSSYNNDAASAGSKVSNRNFIAWPTSPVSVDHGVKTTQWLYFMSIFKPFSDLSDSF